MSGPGKKRAVDGKAAKPESADSQSSDEESNPDIYDGGEEIQVDFEGRTPQDPDFGGIKQLLLQLFLKAHVNLSKLAEIIIEQNYVGSVVKQSDLENAEDDDEEDMESDINDVFGVTSVINLMERQNTDCIQQLRTLLSELSQEYAEASTTKLIKEILSDSSNPVGFIINERFVNIPAQISVPLLESLHNEIEKAAAKDMPFKFRYFILISKMYKCETEELQSGERRNSKQNEIIWSNPEEEMIAPEALASFEFSVKNESDSGLAGHWLEDDVSMSPYRKVLILDARKFDRVIDAVKNYVAQV